MCYYVEYGEKYSGCTVSSKHVVLRRRYDMSKALDNGYTCGDATPAKGLNGRVIQLATSKKSGAYPKCLSFFQNQIQPSNLTDGLFDTLTFEPNFNDGLTLHKHDCHDSGGYERDKRVGFAGKQWWDS